MTGRVFTLDQPVRFEDVDAAGIMYYPRTVAMLARVVEEWFAGPLGCDYNELHLERRLGIPTATLEIAFRAPGRLGQVLTWALVVTELRSSAFLLRYEVTAPDGTLHLEARQRLVCASLDGIAKVAIPPDIRARMADYLEGPETVIV
ncbi:MAG: acyl-CoA thioesterase [Rhodobacterales bacterium]|nr:acyl-CoA thioesterase [Rhodobacterales bacterium]